MRIRISKEQNLHDIENFIDYLNKHSLCSAKLVIDSNKYYLEI
jgi:DNA/RNA-binding domain of Phe-tRNA-synthetase-like protein